MNVRCQFVLLVLLAAVPPAPAQLAQRGDAGAQTQKSVPPHRTRLILKDGSYQIVMSWRVVGGNVEYVSAERGGDTELIPLDLVDLDATKKWDAQHPFVDGDNPRPAPAIDPELLREEAERKLLAPEVAPDLRLAPEDAALALDTFRGTPELVQLTQTDGELNRQTGHSVLRSVLKPQAAPHQMVVIKGEKAAVQLHVPDPAFYMKLDDELPPGGHALTVDTGGAASRAPKDSPQGRPDYVILRVDVRQDARVLASFNLAQLGVGKRQEDVYETNIEVLPGGHWMKVTAQEKLLFGEYALVEILDEKSINLGVWDFGVHPTAPENRDILKPDPKRPITLEKRRPGD